MHIEELEVTGLPSGQRPNYNDLVERCERLRYLRIDSIRVNKMNKMAVDECRSAASDVAAEGRVVWPVDRAPLEVDVPPLPLCGHEEDVHPSRMIVGPNVRLLDDEERRTAATERFLAPWSFKRVHRQW